MKIKFENEIDTQDYGLVQIGNLKEANKLLHDVYQVLWCEAYYDPTNDLIMKFAKPLADKMTEANKILGYKK